MLIFFCILLMLFAHSVFSSDSLQYVECSGTTDSSHHPSIHYVRKNFEGDSKILVNLSGIRNNDGLVRASLFDTSKGFPGDSLTPCQKSRVTLNKYGAHLFFDNLPKGKYAIVFYHDENSNHEFDKNLIGLPREGYGMSNNPFHGIIVPKFKEAAFELDSDSLSIDIKVNY